MIKCRNFSQKYAYLTILLLSSLLISNSTRGEEKSQPFSVEIYSDFHIATGLFYSSRDPGLESKSAELLIKLIDRLNERTDFSSSQEAASDYSEFMKMLGRRAQLREPVTDYDCENLAAMRDKLVAYLERVSPDAEECKLAADDCFRYAKSMWSKVLSAYLYKSTDPAGMGGHSYFIEGETTTDIDDHIRMISAYLPDTLHLSVENQSSWTKLQFLKQSILQQQAGSVPFLVVHYIGLVYGLD